MAKSNLLLRFTPLLAFLMIVSAYVLLWLMWLDPSEEVLAARFSLLDIFGSVLLLLLSLVVFAILRHQIIWLGLFFALALMGVGIELPHRVVLEPAKLLSASMFLTFLATICFLGLEKLESKYFGVPEFDLLDLGDEITKLDLDREGRE